MLFVVVIGTILCIVAAIDKSDPRYKEYGTADCEPDKNGEIKCDLPPFKNKIVALKYNKPYMGNLHANYLVNGLLECSGKTGESFNTDCADFEVVLGVGEDCDSPNKEKFQQAAKENKSCKTESGVYACDVTNAVCPPKTEERETCCVLVCCLNSYFDCNMKAKVAFFEQSRLVEDTQQIPFLAKEIWVKGNNLELAKDLLFVCKDAAKKSIGCRATEFAESKVLLVFSRQVTTLGPVYASLQNPNADESVAKEIQVGEVIFNWLDYKLQIAAVLVGLFLLLLVWKCSGSKEKVVYMTPNPKMLRQY